MKFFYPLLLISLASTLASAETVVLDGAQLKFVDDVHVSSREAGVVESIKVKPNDSLKSGESIVQLEKDRHLLEIEAAEKTLAIALATSQNDVNVRYAKKSAEVARKELGRAQEAVAKYSRAVSQTELEKKQLELDQAILSGEQATHEQTVNKLTSDLRESELRLKRLNADRRTIKSPLAGQVAELLVQEGEWVDAGTPVARVVNLNKLRIIALVGEELLLGMQQGLPAQWNLQLGEQRIEAAGKVSYVAPEINPVNREFEIWVDIDNKDGKLRPGLVGTLQIELDSTVPNGTTHSASVEK